MSRDVFVTLLQVSTSVFRLGGFAFGVLALGQTGAAPELLLAIGYLPFLAFFDILIQSTSRATHLHGPRLTARRPWARTAYARIALLGLASCLLLSARSPGLSLALVLAAWPAGAIGFTWESWLADKSRQSALAGLEMLLIAAGVAHYLLTRDTYLLVLCFISYPAARLLMLALPGRSAVPATAQQDAQQRWDRRRASAYVGSSLAQQLVAAAAASLPALHAQWTGNYADLPTQLALFRTLHSLAAIAALAVNAMSSRIFYRQSGSDFDMLERAILDHRRIGIALIALACAAAGLIAVLAPKWYIAFSFAILPAMALINLESSILYNRGLPAYTLLCQGMILLLSLAFLMVLTDRTALALVALAGFIGYVAAVSARMFAAHRQSLN